MMPNEFPIVSSFADLANDTKPSGPNTSPSLLIFSQICEPFGSAIPKYP